MLLRRGSTSKQRSGGMREAWCRKEKVDRGEYERGARNCDPVPSTSKGGDYATTAITSLQNGMSTLAKATANISTGAGASGNFFPAQRQTGGSTPNRTGSQDNTAALGDADSMSANTDPWLFPTTRLLYSKLEAPVATVLGYLADESGFRASPENLFRSLSLVLVDNACSEYTFLVRFFEGVSSEGEITLRRSGRSPKQPVPLKMGTRTKRLPPPSRRKKQRMVHNRASSSSPLPNKLASKAEAQAKRFSNRSWNPLLPPGSILRKRCLPLRPALLPLLPLRPLTRRARLLAQVALRQEGVVAQLKRTSRVL